MLQGWEYSDSQYIYTNQLKQLSDSLNGMRSSQPRKLIRSTSPTKPRIYRCYLRSGTVLPQKQHFFQGTYSVKAQFSPKKLHKHYIGPLLQQLRLK